MDEKRAEEEAALRTRFKANEVPLTTKVPMFDNIMRAQEERRERVRAERESILAGSEKPFSFYEKDIQKRIARNDALSANVERELELLRR